MFLTAVFNVLTLLFSITSFLSLCFAFIVFFSDNTVYATLSLIALFFCSFVSLLCIKAEFLAIMYLLLYVGAIAVLFLFVVMFIDLRLEDTWVNESFSNNYWLSLLVLFKTLIVLRLSTGFALKFPFFTNPDAWHNDVFLATSLSRKISYFFNDITAISHLLYTHHMLLLLFLAFLLWSVMLGVVAVCTEK